MALQVSALALLLALPPLLSAQGAAPSPRPTKTPGTCRRAGAWTTKVKFPSEQTAFQVNDTVQVTCPEEPEPGPFPAKCTELKDRGAVWVISGVKCLRMCNDWVRQVDFDPAQTEFGVGAEARVTCRQQFQQNSFSVTCRETESGRFEWDSGAHKCVRKCEIPRTWDSRLQFASEGQFYAPGDSVTLSCPAGYRPSLPVIECVSNGSQAVWSETATCQEKCEIPRTWDSTLQFAPTGPFYAPGDSVTLSCSEGYRPSPPVIECVSNGSQAVWSETPTCRGVCTRAGNWPPSVSAASPQTEFAVGEEVEVTCRQEQYEGRPAWVRCTETAGRMEWDTSRVSCVEKCPRPQWDPRLRFVPDRPFYGWNEQTTLSCPGGFQPSLSAIRCVGWGQTQSHWTVWDRGAWRRITENVTCAEKCKIPRTWDSRLQFARKGPFYALGDSVTLSCPVGYRPSPPVIECVSNGSQFVWNETATCRGVCTMAGNWPPSVSAASPRTEFAVGEEVWVTCRREQYEGSPAWVRCTETAGRVEWDTSRVSCVEKCPRPQWDPRLRFVPDRPFYGQNKQTTLSCPGGFQPSLSAIRCVGWGQTRSHWTVRDRGAWRRITEIVTCAETPRIVPGALEISPTTIKLRWTCEPPESCQGSWKIQAQCRQDGPLSDPCRRLEHTTREQPLQGQDRTVTCSSLHPFTSYNVTISGGYPATRPPSTVLYSRRVNTSEAAPDQPKIKPLDPSTKTLRWKQLPPCKGEIVGYQLNITAWREYDSDFLEVEELRVNQSVTKYLLQPWRHGSNYTVTIQGLTAAGLGQASRWDFETNISEPDIPASVTALSVYSISPSNGTALIPLQPVPGLHGPIREYQIIVSAMQNGSKADACRSPGLQPFNSSLERDMYLAAVLPAQNLTGPTDFVLGDGARHSGYYNAPLRPHRNYTAFVRVVSRWKQMEKSSCVRYDFSVGEAQTPQPGGLALAVAVPVLVLLATGALLLWFLLARKKRNDSKDHNSNGAIPLKRNRGGASRLRTQIPVAELLESLKRFKRAEMEEEGIEDDANPERPPVGRNAEYQKLVSGLLHPSHAGKEPCNQAKNRYKSVIPYDHCRVVLQSASPGADYINASYVDSYRSPCFFIAAQGPLPGTVVDFWQMIWQEKTSAIVMLTGLVEQNKTKCEQYWPEGEQLYGDFTVTLSNIWTTTGLVTRTFRLQRAGSPLPRHIQQFHYLLWPDHGVPSNAARLLQLVEMVNERVSEAPAGPVLVHCSAGIGRTGTFIALDILLKMARAEGSVDVFRCVQRLREQRVSMVQTKEQYIFLYEALLEGLLCGNTGVLADSVPSHVSRLRQPDAQSQSNGFSREFKALQKFSELFQLSPCKEAQQPSNQPKNRKPTILPADCNRPILMSSLNADGSPGYINAVFVGTYAEEDNVIVTQLPLRETLVDFWALLWDYTCTMLVMLNRLEELDQTYLAFWPAHGEASYGRFHVELISEEPGAGFTIRTLAVTNRQQPKKPAQEIRLWQVDDWPMQQQLPPRPATIISLLGEVERSRRTSQDSHVLVTCWDGASRCGLFCAASFMCEQIRSEGLLDVSQAVRMLKRRRRQMIKDVAQYTFCYELALSYLDSFKLYGNFK
ncbi:receptor-type tyrosine-protein phosphatase kappa-like isoform X2 [Mauremys reevesii]|uniref:receptor-type tyrosine-protein phosphatase kappa-like isoform X2 n=1 Tax=Mauremys reevesii TaxID=260615 RepID=UPI00193F07BD|nr:receptor-type tyrosine-protein phosphatase kappa-like isoform X2 [Mauremys reevesii]